MLKEKFGWKKAVSLLSEEKGEGSADQAAASQLNHLAKHNEKFGWRKAVSEKQTAKLEYSEGGNRE